MRGITLTELLITTVIVSIMMAGIFAGSLAIQGMNKAVTDRSELYIRTQKIVDTIMSDASQATGTSANVGVCINNTSDDQNYFCFRNAANWACYSRLNNASNYRVLLYRCTYAITASCLTGSVSSPCASSCGAAKCSTGDTYVDTLVTDVFSAVQPAFSNGIFTMPVINRVDPTVGSGTSTKNPQVTFDIIAYPEGHSF
ncbi:MAG: prepilin-type N-terminal cleavage/methylation domain-containing protein [Candidatus Omnitrophica bacterium]|nr:prepilin-type N-terminal cleavage/methylation domain-containing protein [Candidatus Omnitrophota bacterium]